MKKKTKYMTLEEYLTPPPRPPRGNKKWSPAELTRLLFLQGEGRTPAQIAKVLGRTEIAIRVKLGTLGGLRFAWQ
ncbi:MAG: hypothetical protein VX528_11270 [Candidatus Latescibacterota bacterium]|nr:hypothetical protein [Candidatus Latescibacterota bacterium]